MSLQTGSDASVESSPGPRGPDDDRWLQGYWAAGGFVPWIFLGVKIGQQKGFELTWMDAAFAAACFVLFAVRIADAWLVRARPTVVVRYALIVLVLGVLVWGGAHCVALQRG